MVVEDEGNVSSKIARSVCASLCGQEAGRSLMQCSRTSRLTFMSAWWACVMGYERHLSANMKRIFEIESGLVFASERTVAASMQVFSERRCLRIWAIVVISLADSLFSSPAKFSATKAPSEVWLPLRTTDCWLLTTDAWSIRIAAPSC